MSFDAIVMYKRLIEDRLDYGFNEHSGHYARGVYNNESKKFVSSNSSIVSEIGDRVKLAIVTPLLSLNLVTQCIRSVDFLITGLFSLNSSRIKAGCLNLLVVALQAVVLPILYILSVISPKLAADFARGYSHFQCKAVDEKAFSDEAQPEKKPEESQGGSMITSCVLGLATWPLKKIHRLACFIIDRSLVSIAFVVNVVRDLSMNVIAPKFSQLSENLFYGLFIPVAMIFATPGFLLCFPKCEKSDSGKNISCSSKPMYDQNKANIELSGGDGLISED